MTKAFPLKGFTDKSVYNNKSFLLKCKLNIPLGNKRKGNVHVLVLLGGQENGRGEEVARKESAFPSMPDSKDWDFISKQVAWFMLAGLAIQFLELGLCVHHQGTKC